MFLSAKRLFRSLMVSLWFMCLVFPIMGIKIVKKVAVYSFDSVFYLGIGIFFASLAWAWYFEVYLQGGMEKDGKKSLFAPVGQCWKKITTKIEDTPSAGKYTLLILLVVFSILPFVSSMYQTTIFALAFLYVMLALGLNIVVGIAGQLVLGYAAFYAIGAYTYALLNQYLGFGFWICLPIAGFVTVIAGFVLAFPVLKLRGDYLAIVTLGFGEIVRLLITNFSDFTGGAKGVSNIPRPSFFGMELSPNMNTIYVYYLALFAALITIVVVARLKDSRVGMALQALKDDEIASEAMGIDLRKTKLAAFALGSCWAGFAGVLFAARNSFISPASFTFMDSVMILSMVVLGGMGSITGVALAALILALMPEYLRAFSEYRMLIFGLVMVLMMIFRPQGMIPPSKRKYYPSALFGKKGSVKNDSAQKSPANTIAHGNSSNESTEGEKHA